MENGLGDLQEVLDWSFDQIELVCRKGKLARTIRLQELSAEDAERFARGELP